MSDSVERWIVLSLVLMNAYCLGANCVERFVNYATWPFIPARSFRAYHKAQGPLIRLVVVMPIAVAMILQISLLFFESKLGIGAGIIWTMVVSSMVGVMSTVMIQIPIHRRFDADGYSTELMRRLLATDWIRKAADGARIVATVLLLKRMISL